MWSTIFNVAAGLGGMYAFLALRNRDGATSPAGIPEGTPVREWPKEERRKKLHYDAARHWKAYLVCGALAFLFGITGIVFQLVDVARGPSAPSRDELIDLVASDPENSYDREEATCVFELMEEVDLDIFALDRDEFLRAFTQALLQMSDTQLERMDGCLDDESRARRGESMNDAQLREFFIEVLIADPSGAIDRATATCIVDVIEERGLLRDALHADQSLTPELEAAFIESETACP